MIFNNKEERIKQYVSLKLGFRLLLLVIFPLLFTSCLSKEELRKSKESAPVFETQFINWRVMNEAGWRNVSFPIWFSTDWVDSMGIEEMTLTFTNYNVSDSLTNVTDTLPYKSIEISFNRKGEVKEMVMYDFNFGKNIAKHTFTYHQALDSNGYSIPNVTLVSEYEEKDALLSMISTLQDLQEFKRLEMIAGSSDMIAYDNQSIPNRITHYFVPDSSNWNVSFIDKVLNPGENDVIYFGSPKQYLASFSIQNLVERTKIEEFEYYSTGVLKRQIRYSDGFMNKRFFDYDETGRCVGFVDSLCTATNDFIHTSVGRTEYQSNLPKAIAYYGHRDSTLVDPTKVIRFSYQLTE